MPPGDWRIRIEDIIDAAEAIEIEARQFKLELAGRTGSLFENRARTESRILSARRPRQIPERLHFPITGERVHEVPRFDTSHEGENLRSRQIEGVQGKSEFFMRDEREEPVCAVVRPLDQNGIRAASNLCLYKPRSFTPDRYLESCSRQGIAIGLS